MAVGSTRTERAMRSAVIQPCRRSYICHPWMMSVFDDLRRKYGAVEISRNCGDEMKFRD